MCKNTFKLCPECQGSGQKWICGYIPHSGDWHINAKNGHYENCSKCNGAGYIFKKEFKMNPSKYNK